MRCCAVLWSCTRLLLLQDESGTVLYRARCVGGFVETLVLGICSGRCTYHWPTQPSVRFVRDAPPRLSPSRSIPFARCSQTLLVPSTSKSRWARRLSTGRKWWRWSRERESPSRCLRQLFLVAWSYRAPFRYCIVVAVGALLAFQVGYKSGLPKVPSVL